MIFNIEFVNLNEVGEAYRAIEDLSTYFGPTMRQWGSQVFGTLAGRGNYPAESPGQTYERTGTLGAGWSWDGPVPGERDAVVAFINPVAYGPLVLGDDVSGGGQAWMHRGRWWVAFERVGSQMDTLLAMCLQHLSKWPSS